MELLVGEETRFDRPAEQVGEVAPRVGQRSLSVTADTYTHALVDYREIDRPKLLERVQDAATAVPTLPDENLLFAGTFLVSTAHCRKAR